MSVPVEPSEVTDGKPSGLSPNSFSNSSYWLLVRDMKGASSAGSPSGGSVRRESRDLEVLSLDTDDEKWLPVFGSEESGRLFAQALSRSGKDTFSEDTSDEDIQEVPDWWRPRGTGAVELLSLLSASSYSAGQCADVEKIVSNPSPAAVREIGGKTTVVDIGELVTMNRRCFLETLMGRGRSWFETRDLGRKD